MQKNKGEEEEDHGYFPLVFKKKNGSTSGATTPGSTSANGQRSLSAQDLEAADAALSHRESETLAAVRRCERLTILDLGADSASQ